MIYGTHESWCPLYRTNGCAKCSVCGESIVSGEEYIEDSIGRCAHYDCLSGKKQLLDFLDYEIKIMKG